MTRQTEDGYLPTANLKTGRKKKQSVTYPVKLCGSPKSALSAAQWMNHPRTETRMMMMIFQPGDRSKILQPARDRSKMSAAAGRAGSRFERPLHGWTAGQSSGRGVHGGCGGIAQRSFSWVVANSCCCCSRWRGHGCGLAKRPFPTAVGQSHFFFSTVNFSVLGATTSVADSDPES